MMSRMGLLLVVIACIALAVTNPGEKAHKKVVYDKVANKVGMEGFLGEIAGKALGDLDVVPLTYNNYLLFSTMAFRDDTVSIGCLTRVWETNWEK